MTNAFNRSPAAEMSDRLRLQIIQMARRNSELVQKRQATQELENQNINDRNIRGREDRPTRDKTVTYKRRDRIDLDLIRGKDRDVRNQSKLLYNRTDIRKRVESKTNYTSPKQNERSISHSNDPHTITSSDYRKSTPRNKVDQVSNASDLNIVKKYGSLPRASTGTDQSNIKTKKLEIMKTVRNITTPRYQSTSNERSSNARNGDTNVGDVKNHNVTCEVKGSALLSPRFENLMNSPQINNNRSGLFSDSLKMFKRRLKGKLRALPDDHNKTEDYIIRAQNIPTEPEPLECKIKACKAIPFPLQNIDYGPPIEKINSQRPRTSHIPKNISRNGRKTCPPIQSKYSPRESVPLSDVMSSTNSEYNNGINCSYQLPGEDSVALPSILDHTGRAVASVKTYVLEIGQKQKGKQELSALTTRNLKIHETILSSRKLSRDNVSFNRTSNNLTTSSFNFNFFTNASSMPYLESQEIERIFAWLKDICPENGLPTNTICASENEACLQSSPALKCFQEAKTILPRHSSKPFLYV